MTEPLKLIIHGASGRNGKRLIALGSLDPQVKIVGAIASANSTNLGQDAGSIAGILSIGVKITHQWPNDGECVIDFSSPEGSQHVLDECLKRRIPAVIASTGLEPHQIERIRDAANTIPICYAPNMSIAVNLTMKLVEQTARALKNSTSGVDVEIIERHHRFKEDSPSGTALKFGQIVANEMNIEKHVHGRAGLVGKRPHNEIGYHAVRVGDDAGQHTIIFGMMGETIELRVAASNRDCYATGAIMAAKFLQGKPARLYSMFDVLGLT